VHIRRAERHDQRYCVIRSRISIDKKAGFHAA